MKAASQSWIALMNAAQPSSKKKTKGVEPSDLPVNATLRRPIRYTSARPERAASGGTMRCAD